MKDTKLTPRIAETAKGLWLVYFGFTAACFIAYWLAGMSWLDALMHAFTTMGLGGFSSHDASFAHWDSPAIEAVAIVFMLLAAINFATHFLAWRRLSAAPYRRDPEATAMLLVLVVFVLGIAGYLRPERRLRRLLHRAALRGLQRRLGRDHHRVRQQSTTTQWPIFAPLWHAVPVELRQLLGLDRQRHQDDPRADPLQADLPRAAAHHPPAACTTR